MRYEKECERLKSLSLKQLNLEKNVVKGDFQGLKIDDIFSLFLQEVDELKDEIAVLVAQIKSTIIDSRRVDEELGDCGAVLAGLIAKIDSTKQEMEIARFTEKVRGISDGWLLEYMYDQHVFNQSLVVTKNMVEEEKIRILEAAVFKKRGLSK